MKATNKGPNSSFRISAAELKTARDCIQEGIRYEIHRVYHVRDKRTIDRCIITAEELFRDYEITKGKMDDVFLAITGRELTGGDKV